MSIYILVGIVVGAAAIILILAIILRHRRKVKKNRISVGFINRTFGAEPDAHQINAVSNTGFRDANGFALYAYDDRAQDLVVVNPAYEGAYSEPNHGSAAYYDTSYIETSADNDVEGRAAESAT